MSEEDLRDMKELESKNKPRILTMYFEDGGEIFVIPYDDYDDLQQRIDKAIKYIDKCRFNEVLIDMGSEYVYETDYFKDNILSILKGENKE